MLVFVALAILTTGGIGYVVMKNQQITARRNIAKVDQLMEEHRVAIELHQSDIAGSLGVFDLQAKLNQLDSNLQEISHGVVELCLVPAKNDTSEAIVSTP